MFVAVLKSEIPPLVKAYYHPHRLPPPSSLSIIRLYTSPKSTFVPSKSTIAKNTKPCHRPRSVMYIALLGSCPYVWAMGWEWQDSCKSRHGSDEEDHIGSHTQSYIKAAGEMGPRVKEANEEFEEYLRVERKWHAGGERWGLQCLCGRRTGAKWTQALSTSSCRCSCRKKSFSSSRMLGLG
jgi:hypothetical protein